MAVSSAIYLFAGTSEELSKHPTQLGMAAPDEISVGACSGVGISETQDVAGGPVVVEVSLGNLEVRKCCGSSEDLIRIDDLDALSLKLFHMSKVILFGI